VLVCASVDSDSTEVSSEATLPVRETDDPSSEPSADDNVVGKPAGETKEAESDASPGVADKDAVDSSARASDMERSAVTLTTLLTALAASSKYIRTE